MYVERLRGRGRYGWVLDEVSTESHRGREQQPPFDSRGIVAKAVLAAILSSSAPSTSAIACCSRQRRR